MKHESSGSKLPKDEDSWESLASNLFGIDFSKPAISVPGEIAWELPTERETPPPSSTEQASAQKSSIGQETQKSDQKDVPLDEDVRLTNEEEEEEDLGWSDEEPEELGWADEVPGEGDWSDEEADEVGWSDEESEEKPDAGGWSAEKLKEPEEPRELEDIPVAKVESSDDEEDFGEFDEDESEDEDDDEEAEAEEDTYWEALNDFEWDADVEDESSKASGSHEKHRGRSGKPQRGGSGRRGPENRRDEKRGPENRGPENRSDETRRDEKRDPEKRRPDKPAVPATPAEERAIVDDEMASAADYYEEYDDTDFGVGLIEETARAEAAAVSSDDFEPDEDTSADLESEEATPDRKRRRRRRRRRTRPETSEPRDEAPSSKTEEADFITEDDMDFESLDLDEPEPVRGKPARQKVEPQPRGERAERSSDRPSKREPVALPPAASFDDEDEPDDDDAPAPAQVEYEDDDEDDDDGSLRRPRRKESDSADSSYHNVPSWEEAISHLTSRRSTESGSGRRSDRESSRSGESSGGSRGGSGGRRRRRRP